MHMVISYVPFVWSLISQLSGHMYIFFGRHLIYIKTKNHDTNDSAVDVFSVIDVQ